MRVMLTGADDPLGEHVRTAFAGHEAVAMRDLDCRVEADVVAAVRDHGPDLVVHTPGPAGDDWESAAAGAWWVARACALGEAAMVLVSGGAVFGSQPVGPRSEFDPTAPDTPAGRGLDAAEKLVRAALGAHYIARLGLPPVPVGALLDDVRSTGAVTVPDGPPASVAFPADAAAALRRIAVSGRFGTYHLANAGACTPAEFAAASLEAAGVDAEVRTGTGTATAGGVVLEAAMIRIAGVPPLAHWRDALARTAAKA